MKIFDISQEVFSSSVFEGDPKPQKEILFSMDKGSAYNLTSFSMCAHNGTHVDAPRHFIKEGESIDEVSLYKTVGFAFVKECDGDLSGNDAERIIKEAKSLQIDAYKRILIKGTATVTANSAEVFAREGISLLASEKQTVGPENEPMEVHNILLKSGVVLLEGIRLDLVPEGVYFLSAAPLSLEGADGAPCRAILIEF